jgi:RNA recognition motif-containing protein
MSRKLFVGNLPFSTSEGELHQLFEQAGPIESVRVMRDMATGRARGFAFVEMQTGEDAQAAIQRFNGTELGGRTIVVNLARPKPEFAGAGAGRGRESNRREPRW